MYNIYHKIGKAIAIKVYGCATPIRRDGKMPVALLSKMRSPPVQLRFILVFAHRVNIVPLAI
ncbi:hypothetical protein [Microcoleus sp. herbarium12]|uniref:hypothetical protein n=1 Tax=Microcoleus sp. herbarium12 TaxID=3055437 RepID=UPI002FD3A3FD